MKTITLGKRYQLTIPEQERKRLKLRPDSKLGIEAHARCLVLYPVTAHGLRGLGRELADPTDASDYVKKLRAEWDKRR